MPSLVTGRLPVRLTPLVGRQRELEDIVHSLSRSRLLTLTGPGGIGKTRLALATAGAVGLSYAEGVTWVELASLVDPGMVPRVVARRVGVPDCPGQNAVTAIAEHVGDRLILIVSGQLRASGFRCGRSRRAVARRLSGHVDPRDQPRGARRGRGAQLAGTTAVAAGDWCA